MFIHQLIILFVPETCPVVLDMIFFSRDRFTKGLVITVDREKLKSFGIQRD